MTILVLMARPSSGWEIPGGVEYRAFVFEPLWGGRIALGKVEKRHVLPENSELSRTSFCPTSGPPTGYRPPQLPSPQDWVLVMEKVSTRERMRKRPAAGGPS